MRSTLSTFNEIWQRQCRADVLIQAEDFSEDSKFLIGCSGGLDSMLLLHLMSVLFPQRVRAIYIDHQLQASSAIWGEFVQHQCQNRHLPCVIEKVQLAEGNLEQQARQARYQAYANHIQTDEILVLAHHQQDQAETLLLRLFSGAGVQGLSAMKALDQRNNLKIWRPLLTLSREQIQLWAAQLQLQHIEDPTNTDTHYDRAWSREILWPILTQRFPQMQAAIARSSYLMQDAQQILHDVLVQDWQHCVQQNQVDLACLNQLSSARQRQLLSSWMQGDAVYRPSFEMVQRLQQEVIHAKSDAQAALHHQGYYYVRYQHYLYRLAAAEYLAAQSTANVKTFELNFELNREYQFDSGVYCIENQNASTMGLSDKLLGERLVVGPRLGGEKIHLYGRVGSWPLKKAIQAAQIFPWQRHTIQILRTDNVMLGVLTPKGFWLAQSPYCEMGGWLPKLKKHSTLSVTS